MGVYVSSSLLPQDFSALLMWRPCEVHGCTLTELQPQSVRVKASLFVEVDTQCWCDGSCCWGGNVASEVLRAFRFELTHVPLLLPIYLCISMR